ncbi:Flagellar biosynthetic protein FlhB [Hydrogenophaga sp. T4]|nr:Flagellar biosynthetic protein FlhB [Hydrogenophaga sp. T4]
MDSSSQDKNLPATAQRLKKARDDGQVARSKDLSNLSVLGGGAVLLMVLLPMGFDQLRTNLQQQLHFDHQALQQPQMVVERLTGVFGQGLMLYLPMGLLMIALAIGVAFASGSWALSTKPITPDLTRLSRWRVLVGCSRASSWSRRSSSPPSRPCWAWSPGSSFHRMCRPLAPCCCVRWKARSDSSAPG